MNEEEKNAINFLKETNFDYLDYDMCVSSVETISNLFERLQKENEELKNKNKTLEELLQGTLYEMYKYYRDLANSYQANCISKEKVKDKIEELSKTKGDLATHIAVSERIRVLQELLESEDSKDGEN